MDLQQNGESSNSPHHINSEQALTSRLILPDWDIPSPKPLHPSQDFLTLLQLDGLYNTHVRPFGDTGSSGKKRRLEKGFLGFLEDCVDPTPLLEKDRIPQLIPLLSDPSILQLPIEPLSVEYFSSARLDAGLQQAGYAGGEKLGVREAESRRQKKRLKQLSLQPTSPPPLPSPTASDKLLIDSMAPVPLPTRGDLPPRGYAGRGIGGRGGGGGARMTVPPRGSFKKGAGGGAGSRSASPLGPGDQYGYGGGRGGGGGFGGGGSKLGGRSQTEGV